jgi:WD40 repeat protein/serine/threonine protein kinase/Flp pilus assembly protein TadD
MTTWEPQANALFLKTLQRSPDERPEFLDRACGGDAALRAQVASLLEARGGAASFPESPAQTFELPVPPLVEMADGPVLSQPTASPGEGPGTVIGPYKLLQQIGEGGMGAVYMAEQTAPVQRKVAVKVIKAGMDSKQVIARFEAERQALAMMDHANIARVLDAGATESGRPYFVMELVLGVPITQYCDDNRLTPRERLELFVPVCQAIQHAHQKGIIHRDVKPSNVMITLYEGKPVPKVIDFGVAKATEQRLTERTLLTQYGAMVGTLEYMSPEQAEMNGLGVDSRSDIFSLGVLLYELLTGNTPLSHKRVREAAYCEVLRLIQEEEPPRPSTRLSDSGEALASISAQRHMEPAKLAKLMRGELDWIVMKTLEKDRNRRYETASGFAADVQRYLNDEPVKACPATALYRFRKFARRNKPVLVTAGIIALALVLGTAVSVWQAIRATQAGNVAEERAEQLQQDLKSLQAANTLIETARAHADLRQWDKAEADFTKAAQRRPDHALVWIDRRDFHARLGLWELAANDSLQALTVLEPGDPSSCYHHALLRLYAGDSQGYRQACARMVERFGQATDPRFSDDLARACLLVPDPVVDPVRLVGFAERANVAVHLPWRAHTLGTAHYRAGHYEQAVFHLRDSLTVDPNWPGRTLNHAVLAMAYHCLGQADEARQALENAARLISNTTQEMLRNDVGEIPPNWCDWLESLLLYREAKILIDGSPPPADARLHVARARVFACIGDKEKAEAACAKAVELEPTNLTIRLECSLVYGNLGQWDRALSHLSKASELERADANLGFWWFQLAIAHWHVGEKDEAGHWYGQALKWMATNQPRNAKLRRLRAEAAYLLGIQDHRRFQGHNQLVRSVVFSSDGTRALSGGDDRTLRLWDVATGKELRCFKGHDSQIWSVALSPDGRRALSASRDMRLWDLETGKELLRFQHPSGVWSVAFSPDGRRALSGTYKTLHLWDLESGKELARLGEHTDVVRSVTFSPDGQLALSGSHDGTIRLWDLATGKEIRRLTGHKHLVLSVAFSPDGRHALSGGCDKTVRLWDVPSGEQLGCFRGHQWNVESVAFSPDGRRALSGSSDGTIRLWELPAGRELCGLGTEDVFSVAFSPDGRQVLSANADSMVRLWSLPEVPKEKAVDGTKPAR